MHVMYLHRLFSPGLSRQRMVSALLVTIAVIGVACGSDPGSAAPAPTSQTGPDGTVVKADNKAPSFTVETYAHGTYDFDATVGRPVLLNFWFPSCPPCVAEMPDLEAAYEEYGDEIDFLGVQLVGVDTIEDGVKFLGDLGITYPNFADKNEDGHGQVQRDYRILSYPTTVFLNRDHSINRTWSGLITEQSLREQIEAVING